jgi:hypothetical protein
MHTVRERSVFIGQWILVAFIAFAFTAAVTKPIVLTASDLGRHLTNGKLFLDQGIIHATNAYSYTHPDFPFLNHHWGSGVLFELARRFRGFVGVSLFGLSVVFLTTALYLRIAWSHGTLWITATTAALLLPVFASRAEIRPELFSYLLSAVFLWILLGVRSGAMPRRTLIALPAMLLLWVNLHIYFFLGIGWIGAFFIDSLARARFDRAHRDEHLRLAAWIALTLAACCAAALINPNGWKGAIYPLLIFQDYAYAVAENQSVTAMEKARSFPYGFYFKITLCTLCVSWIWRLWRDRNAGRIPDVALLVLTLFVSVIAWRAIRNFTIFSYVTLVAIPYAWSDVDLRERLGRWTSAITFSTPVLVLLLAIAAHPPVWRATYGLIAIGTAPGITRSIDFFKTNGLKGPVFNNYDIGGFLTYGLYPEERVFVDNRPEAYPGTFFTDLLLPMQMDEAVWKRADERFGGFNVIFFYRLDATRWGQGFMLRRVKDPDWAPVYADNFVLMLVRRTPEHAAVIERYEIPQSRFEAVPRPTS